MENTTNGVMDVYEVGKTRDAPHYAGAYTREPTYFGEILTGDVCYLTDAVGTPGTGGFKYAYIQESLHKHRFCSFHPLRAQRTWDIFWAIKHFTGSEKVNQYYSDSSKQIMRAVRTLGINHEHSQPGVSRSNGIIEALVGSLCDAVRAALVTAGLPGCFWPFAGPCIALLRNVWVHGDGTSAWFERFGETCEGLLIPFGALVWFRPSIIKYELAKTMPRLQPGIFLGYELQSGYRWKKLYYVADLEAFRGIHLNQATPPRAFKNIVHVTRVVKIPEYRQWFFL